MGRDHWTNTMSKLSQNTSFVGFRCVVLLGVVLQGSLQISVCTEISALRTKC